MITMTGGYRKMKLFSLMVALVVVGLAVVGGTWATQERVMYSTPQETLPPEKEFAVVLKYYNKGEEEYKVPDGTKDNNVFSECIWCPGRTELVTLKIENNEQFAVDIDLQMLIDNESGLGNVLTAAWIVENTESYSSWYDFRDAASSNVSRLNVSPIKVLDGSGRNEYAIPANGKIEVELAVHMDESATSEYANLSIKIDFKMQVNADYEPGTTTFEDESSEG